jgi:hypothetical protein
VSEFLTLTVEDDGKLVRVRILNTGEVRISRSSSRTSLIPTIRRTIGIGFIAAGARRPLARFVKSRCSEQFLNPHRLRQAVIRTPAEGVGRDSPRLGLRID